MAKHTPGPWEIKPGREPYEEYRIYGNGEWIASIEILLGRCEEASSNAALIASAPEMAQRIAELEQELKHERAKAQQD